MSALINALSAEGYAVVLTSGPDDREKKMVDTIIAGCPQARLHSLAGQLTLRQLAAVIDHARLFIGVDSVPMHMAAALGTPLVALFGPSKLTFWRPWQAKGEVIWAGDFGPLPDPDAINTNTEERYLDLIPTDAVIAAAKKGTGMSKFRLALVRQKYRPDGGAERFVSRALEALDSSHLQLNVITREWQGPVKPDWQIHICNPRKWGASAASAALPTPRVRSGSVSLLTRAEP